MQDFILREIVKGNLVDELGLIGFDKSYRIQASSKFKYKNIKIYALTVPQANILKQTALAVGADCATHRETITAKIGISDCILGGSISQLNKIADKLKHQPFGLKVLGEKIAQFVALEKNSQTKIVGILNLTSDSFSDGGAFLNIENAKMHLIQMVSDGADIIDIGAESTKPYSKPVSDDVQLSRLLPILEFIKSDNINIPISIDTRSANVAKACIEAGATIINDVSGFDYDENMIDVVAQTGVKVIVQHSKGTPENMQNNVFYESLLDEIYLNLCSKVEKALIKGVRKENIIIDPGIGFGKTREDNFEIIRRIEEFYGLGCDVMLGVSRKSLLNMPEADNDMKDIFTVALNSLAVENKVDYIRVHNVKLHKQLISILK